MQLSANRNKIVHSMEDIQHTKDLTQIATHIRIETLKSLVEAGSGHSAGSLGMADIFAVLYFGGVTSYDPQKPLWIERDRVVLSNGHVCPGFYATLALAGYFPVEELSTLRKLGSRLQGHPHRESLPGLETTSGPLGSGLSQACGMAYALTMDQRNQHVFVLMSDGEHQEGNTWEAILFAAKNRLGNVIAIVDRNNIQIDGFTEDVMPLETINEKYDSFHWHVQDVDGHNHEALIDAINQAKSEYQRPSVIVAHTIPGKGVEFMEELPEWHGKTPSIGETVEALHELRSLAGEIEYD